MALQPDLFAAAPAPAPVAEPGPVARPAPAGVDHRCLGCGKVHADAREVTLVDGSTASSYSEAWRLECEARAVLAIPTLVGRQHQLATIERKRGAKAADQLRAIMAAVWNKRQAEKMRA